MDMGHASGSCAGKRPQVCLVNCNNDVENYCWRNEGLVFYKEGLGENGHALSLNGDPKNPPKLSSVK